MVSGYIEFNINDKELIDRILGDSITAITKSDFPGWYAARFEKAPDEILDKLAPY
jgi:hypothetical protein